MILSIGMSINTMQSYEVLSVHKTTVGDILRNQQYNTLVHYSFPLFACTKILFQEHKHPNQHFTVEYF